MPQLDTAARARERSMLFGAVTDLAMTFVGAGAALWANSLMMGAEVVRGTLLLLLELTLILLMRRIHRERFHEFDYGAGKLEQFANAGIGTAMGLAGISVAVAASYRWWHPPEQEGLGLAAAVAFCVLNVIQNGAVFWAIWKAGRDGASVIMTGQVRTRFTKLVSSGIVLVALSVNALFHNSPIGLIAEVAGSAFVAVVMLQLAVSMWRQALPSLLDRTLEEQQQMIINRALAIHFDAYDSLVSVRSRLSGNTPYVEIELGFAAERQMADVQSVIDLVSAEIKQLMAGAVVVVVPRLDA